MAPSGSASKQARTSARDKVADVRAQQRRQERRRATVIWGAAATVLAMVAGSVTLVIMRDLNSRPDLSTVASYTVEQGHTDKPVKYAQTPPAGGEHAPVWLNCGVYTQPVPNENAVHAMEHGAVWVTYQDTLAKEQVTALTKAMPDTYAVLSPYKDLPSPVVASAWGRQLKLDSATDPRLAAFIREFRQGSQTPEPGASCTGGVDGDGAPGQGDPMMPPPTTTGS